MKKILTLKLIISFIITFLFFGYNTNQAQAATITCENLLIHVSDSVSGDPLAGAQITLITSSGSTFINTTDASGTVRTQFATAIEVSEHFSVTNRGYDQATGTLTLEGTIPPQCISNVLLDPSSSGSSIICKLVAVQATAATSGDPIEGAIFSLISALGSPVNITTGADGTNTIQFATSVAMNENFSVISQDYRSTTGVLILDTSSSAASPKCTATVQMTPLSSGPLVVTCNSISGLVKDSSGNPLENVGIYLDGNSIGVSTDSAGRWSHSPGTGSFSVSLIDAITTSGERGHTSTITVSTDGTLTCTANAIFVSVYTGPDPADVPALAGRIQMLSIGLGVLIAIVRIILGTVKLMSGGDNPITLEEGRDMIVSSILGLLVILFAVTLLKVLGLNVLGIFY